VLDNAAPGWFDVVGHGLPSLSALQLASAHLLGDILGGTSLGMGLTGVMMMKQLAGHLRAKTSSAKPNRSRIC
jgi:hypothetical protein